ncbi:MAG: hypothetical protein EOO17_03625 [Chloroflexi bacterium]|nr:MAG: hypothetical protein EOO17_03625 [Chloroflexota bacterium]
MLIHGSQLPDTPVMGLQTGAELAKISREVINPHDLSIMAYQVDGPTLDHHPSFLRIADIREVSDIGMIIDSSDEFVELDDVIKLKDVYELGFTLVGKHVVDEKQKKVGKVTDYTIELGGFVIQQINVQRPLLKSFSDAELLIHRSQIIEINDTTIVVKSGAEDVRPVMKAVNNYVNPFRQDKPQPNGIDAK